MPRKDYTKTLNESDPVIKMAMAEMDELRPVGLFLAVFKMKNWKIQKVLARTAVKRNGLLDICTIREGELCCTFEQAKIWHEEFQRKEFRKKAG